jgi:hypothetical protein
MEVLHIKYLFYPQLPSYHPNQENELAEHVILMEERFFGLTLNEMPGVAFNLAGSIKYSIILAM